jgi:SAM-dependent methyltransferase
LEARYSKADESGVYFAHQPIYGFRRGHSEPDLFDRYVRTFNILKALARLRFTTLLDVGSAEGFKAYLAKRLLGADVTVCDLSEEACKRCREIFGLRAEPGDIHNLPFPNDSFDVVLCSETLEHVTDFERATSELMRVARGGVVITVPHDPPELLHRHIESGTPHIRKLDLDTFDFLAASDYTVIRQRMLSPLLRLFEVLIEAAPREHHELTRYPKFLFTLYNLSRPLLHRIPTWSASTLIRLDGPICTATKSFRAMLFVVLKDPALMIAESRKISASQLLRESVPLHYLEPPSSATAGSQAP